MTFADACNAVRAHAHREAPREACGYFVDTGAGGYAVVVGRNVHPLPADAFTIDTDAYLEADALGRIAWAYHSHPTTSAEASENDRNACNAAALPYLIYSVRDDSFSQLDPVPAWRSLVGRQYALGVHDCIKMVVDYMRLQHGIEISFENVPAEIVKAYDGITQEQHENWPDGWDWSSGRDVIHEAHAGAGYVEVSDTPKAGDLFTIATQSENPNVLAVYVGGNRLLVAPVDIGISCLEFSQHKKDTVAHQYRHRDLM